MDANEEIVAGGQGRNGVAVENSAKLWLAMVVLSLAFASSFIVGCATCGKCAVNPEGQLKKLSNGVDNTWPCHNF